jgi:cysteine synthase B
MSTPSPAPSPPVHTPAAGISDMVDAIGNTPLLDLSGLSDELPEAVTLCAKAEHMNPGGSVKDRPALRMIEDGLKSGAFEPHQTLIDATSGNTGIAYAMVGATLDIDVLLAMPENASDERKKVLRSFGAELILTDPMESTDGSQRTVKEMVEDDPDRFFYPDQYNNDSNWKAHYDGTGEEIWTQTDGKVTHFVTGLGTTGTFTGTSRRLKEHDDAIRCVAIQPDTGMHGMEGLKHMETAIVPGIYTPDEVDEQKTCTTERAYEMTRRLAREEGLLVGPSAGANVAVALEVAKTLETGTVVTILCDTGTRYLSDDFWTEK